MDFKRPTPSKPTYDNDTHETLPPPQPHVAAAPARKTSRAYKFLASFLLILLIAATGYAVYAYMTEQKLRQDVRAEQERAKLLQEALDGANKTGVAAEKSRLENEKIASFGSFVNEYNEILSAQDGVTVDRAAAKKEIEAELKSYYKIAVLPTSWDVLAIYQVKKDQTPASGELQALVYWPAGAQKPAGFVPMIKPNGGTWKFHEQL